MPEFIFEGHNLIQQAVACLSHNFSHVMLEFRDNLRHLEATQMIDNETFKLTKIQYEHIFFLGKRRQIRKTML